MIQIGIVSYLNTLPLVHGLESGSGRGRYALSYDVPAVLADRMARDEIQVALLPIIALAAQTRLEIVPGLGIVTRGAARSVLLVSRKPIEQIRTVALDPESRTSNAMIRVLFEQAWRCRPEFRPGPVELEPALDDCDAAVRIGDKALFEPPPAECAVFDLGQEWTRHTGLPFVFAVWAVRPGLLDDELHDALGESLRSGLNAVERIAREYRWNGKRHPEIVRAYLRENIQFRVGADEIRAMRVFFGACADLGLIDEAPRLRFSQPQSTTRRPAVAAAGEPSA